MCHSFGIADVSTTAQASTAALPVEQKVPADSMDRREAAISPATGRHEVEALQAYAAAVERYAMLDRLWTAVNDDAPFVIESTKLRQDFSLYLQQELLRCAGEEWPIEWFDALEADITGTIDRFLHYMQTNSHTPAAEWVNLIPLIKDYDPFPPASYLPDGELTPTSERH